MKTLDNLQKWFKYHCNGEWEHKFGINIQSSDNPGWIIKIDVKGTELERREFKHIRIGRNFENNAPEPPWMECYVKDGIFYGAGDISKLERILEVFLKWQIGK